MQQHINSLQRQEAAPTWSALTMQEQIRGIEELMASSCWLLLSPLQKNNWQRQLNGLRCRHLFQRAYRTSPAGTHS